VGTFYEKLLEIEKKSGQSGNAIAKNLNDALSTHPPSEERVRQMRELAAASPVRDAVIHTSQFNRAKQIAKKIGKK
jgi:predicted Zn-dependent protease